MTVSRPIVSCSLILAFGSAHATSVFADPVSTDYEYDALGNRISVTGDLVRENTVITRVEPSTAIPGQRVNIFGENLPWQAKDSTFIFFGDEVVQPIRMSGRVMLVEVPDGVSGLVNMRFLAPGLDEPIELGEFNVSGIRITPRDVFLGFATPFSFSAELFNLAGDPIWSVESIPGGNASVGFIDEFGNYTSPQPSASVPLPFNFSIRAAIEGEPYFGRATVRTGATRQSQLEFGSWAADSVLTDSDILVHEFFPETGQSFGLFMNADPGLRLSLTSPGGLIEQSTTSADAKQPAGRDHDCRAVSTERNFPTR
ncbi:MAG: IPT/TIG domain-containing protein [Phycisphaerales bacterium]